MGCEKVFRQPFHQNDIVIAAQRHNVIARPLDQQNVTRFQCRFGQALTQDLAVAFNTQHDAMIRVAEMYFL